MGRKTGSERAKARFERMRAEIDGLRDEVKAARRRIADVEAQAKAPETKQYEFRRPPMAPDDQIINNISQ